MSRVSVGLPVYNGAAHLDEAVRSLLAQDVDFGLYVSDNGSTDRTEEIARELARDERVRYVRHDQNRGAVWNFNHVFQHTSGELFAWAAHDDRWRPEFLARCTEAFDAQPAASVCNVAWQPMDEAGEPVGPAVDAVAVKGDTRSRWRHVQRDWTVHSAIYGVIRRKHLAGTRLLRPIVAADLLLVAELALRGPIVAVDEVLHDKRVPSGDAVYRSHAEMADYLAGRRVRIGLPRLRVAAAELAALRAVEEPAGTRLGMARDTVAAYLAEGYWAIDLRELGHRLLHRGSH